MVIDESKLDSSFPDPKLQLDNYKCLPQEMQKNVEVKLFFVRNELIAKRITNLKYDSTEPICIVLILPCKKWCMIFAFRPLKRYKRVIFQDFQEKYENIQIKRDLNI